MRLFSDTSSSLPLLPLCWRKALIIALLWCISSLPLLRLLPISLTLISSYSPVKTRPTPQAHITHVSWPMRNNDPKTSNQLKFKGKNYRRERGEFKRHFLVARQCRP